jgi:hypothetical protein
MCQNVVLNSASDFCLWGPPGTNPAENAIGSIEEIVVAYVLLLGMGMGAMLWGGLTSMERAGNERDAVEYRLPGTRRGVVQENGSQRCAIRPKAN